MYALRNPMILRKLSGVVCLSSPFLCYRLAGVHRDLLLFSAVLLGIVAAARGNALLWTYGVVYAFVAVTLLLTQNFGHTKESRDRLPRFRALWQFAHTSVQQQSPAKIAGWIRRFHAVDPEKRIVPPASWSTPAPPWQSSPPLTAEADAARR